MTKSKFVIPVLLRVGNRPTTLPYTPLLRLFVYKLLPFGKKIDANVHKYKLLFVPLRDKRREGVSITPSDRQIEKDKSNIN